ncbi:MAG: hypothetical protein KDD50_07830 [Bdellovibrionales bacterium]|nr:hypothetical protein [Bdellovibrionales bacterium]
MLLNKIRLYKNLIVIFIALNVFSLALAVVFSVSYFKQKSKYYKSFQQSSLIVKQHLSFQQEAEALLLRTLNSEKSKNEQLYTFWQSYKQTLDTQNVYHTI